MLIGEAAALVADRAELPSNVRDDEGALTSLLLAATVTPTNVRLPPTSRMSTLPLVPRASNCCGVCIASSLK